MEVREELLESVFSCHLWGLGIEHWESNLAALSTEPSHWIFVLSFIAPITI